MDEGRFEHESPYQPPEDDADDDLARTQEALNAEREEIDAAVDEHEEERKALHGNGLVWWRDTSLIEAHRAMGDLFDEVLDDFDGSTRLIEHGLDRGVMNCSLPLDFLTGPLVVAGLQLLGLFLPDVRETCADILRAFPYPQITPEEEAALEATVAKIESAAFERAKKHLVEQGVPAENILTPDEYLAQKAQETAENDGMSLN